MHILVADDNHTDLVILQTILRKEGHEVITASDGAKAVRAFEECSPDIVLLDALMPVMDGYEAARRIKKLSSERDVFTPIIFLTSLKDAPALAGCLQAGGDDFLSKPYNKMILQAKLRAFERVRQMHSTINDQREALKQNHESMLREQDVAKRVFDNVAPSGCLDMDVIRHVLSPCSVFNGDMLLVAEKPSGGMHIMMGDFTGHGLQAAIGALPASEVFYGMTRKGFAIQDILIEINKRLKKILPTGLFCCAIFADIDHRNKTVTTWAGGTPDGYIFRQGTGIVYTIESHNLPLGILGSERFDASTRIFSYEEGDIIYMFSDGIVEAENSEQEMFGHKRVEALMDKFKEEKGVFERLFDALNEFTGVEAQGDDITLVEVECRPSSEGGTYEKDSDLETRSGPLEWSFAYTLRPGSIKQFDPLPLLLHILMECPGLQPHRGRLYTILAELYSNALEHGVLGLDSEWKSDNVGFNEYYTQRKSRLEALENAEITFRLRHDPTPDGGLLTLHVEDSGDGFDYSDKMAQLCKALGDDEDDSSSRYSGRGMGVIGQLVKSMEYQGRGNIVKVEYEWFHSGEKEKLS